MGLGTIIAQSINVLIQPILTRIVPAETLGIYTYIVSLATIVIPIASLKLDMLIVSEQDDNEAQYITDACVVINVLVAAIYSIVLTVGYFLPADNIFNKYGVVVFWVPLLTLTNGLRFLFISYSDRYKQYKLISVMGMIREGSRAVIQIMSGLLKCGVGGLTLGYALAPLFGMNLQLKDYFAKRKQRAKLTPKQFENIIFDKGKRQILYMVPAQFINSFSASFVTISITALYTAKELGYYSTGVRILEIPIIFITANVSKVCYQKISENVSKRKGVLKLFLSVLAGLTVISVVGFVILYFVAPQLCGIVFGEEYDIAGEYIRALCVMYAIRLVASSFSGIYTVFKKQNIECILNALLIVFGVISAALSWYFELTINRYLTLICIGYTVTYTIMLIGYYILCMRHDKNLTLE